MLKEGLGKGKELKGKAGGVLLHIKTWRSPFYAKEGECPGHGGECKVECGSGKFQAKQALPNLEEDVRVVYSKCSLAGEDKCASPGAQAGEIRLSPLRGELGYVEESPGVKVGLKLESEVSPGGSIAEFVCGAGSEFARATLSGEVVGLQEKDLNQISKESGLVDGSAARLGELFYYESPGIGEIRYTPLVNILGWASELPQIEAKEAPPRVLQSLLCGEWVQSELKIEGCAPLAYGAIDQAVDSKGEALMVKT